MATARRFARLTGTNPRTVRRWLSGASVVPQWVAVLLGEMAERRG